MLRRVLSPILLAALFALAVGQAFPAGAYPPPHLGYGVMLAYPPGSLSKVPEAGFDWYKYFLYWDDPWGWALSLEGHLNDACNYGLNLILRVERGNGNWTPIQPSEMVAWQDFFYQIADRIRQKRDACPNEFRVALEVWNEPNLDFQWGGQPVDPVRYTEMVQAAYQGTKAADPGTILVAGGLAPTGGTGDGRAMNDVNYLEAMYDAGLKGYFDAIATHNYGFGGPPEDEGWGSGILNFRRAEDIYAVMVDHGDGNKPVWGTEFGWLLEEPECVGYWQSIGFAWQRVSAQQQADYLVRAFQYADANWPWMGVMVVSNLDFNSAPWGYPHCEPLCWFSILEPDRSPRLAYTALQGMSKRYRSWSVWGMGVLPPSIVFPAGVGEPGAQTRLGGVLNTGWMAWDSWSLITATESLDFAVTPTGGAPGDAFSVQVDSTGYLTGTYTGVITVTASEPSVPESPTTVPVTLYVWPEIHRLYLPLAMAWQ